MGWGGWGEFLSCKLFQYFVQFYTAYYTTPKGPRDRDRGASSKVPGPPSSSRGSGPPTGRMGGPQNNSNRPGAGGPGGRPGGSQTSRDRHPPSTRPGGPPGRSAPGKPGLQQGRGESSRESLSAPNKGPPHQRVERTSSATQDRGGLSGSQGRRVGAVEGARNQSGQKREECMASVRGRREQLPKNASPKRGSADRDRKDRDSRQLPGRLVECKMTSIAFRLSRVKYVQAGVRVFAA